ncbi:uncharacterized protein TA15240 [Theileria annulata]|uniref:Uncharacterized protein n=1 Tax=Theileria annulata TaxID=5874 RepID=Q4UFE2_THEAN|nr:uncharacterized protein TA15240 [Theileria annulata]CAI74174.1 hypothetical protein TA15240 [Theileria annulata]|eukprot:XP_951906.1 hypothetical protein TA15240 [Theileria annulata]
MYVKSEYVNEFVDHLYNFSSDDSVLLVSEGVSLYLLTDLDVYPKWNCKILRESHRRRKIHGPCDYPSIESQMQSKRWNVKMVCYNEFYNMNTSEEEKKRIIVILHVDNVFQELEDFKYMRELGASFSHFMLGLLYKDFNKLPNVVDLFIVKENYDYNSKDPYFVPFGVNFDPETEIDFQYFKTTCFDKILLDDPGSETIEYNTN